MKASPSSLNLHFDSESGDLAARIADEEQGPVLVLSGEPASGRRYLLRAAAAEARRRGCEVWLSSLDLDGYEPEADSVEPYVRFQLSKRGRLVGPTPDATVAALAAAPARDALERTLLAALVLGRDDASDALVPGALAGGLAALLPEEATARRLVGHFADVAEMSVLVRERFLGWAEREERLRPVLSCRPGDGRGIVGPGRDLVRFEIQPLEAGEIATLVEARLGRSLPLDDAREIQQRSAGVAGIAARLVDPDAAWKDPLEALSETPDDERVRIRTLLHLAALCGENAPVRALAAFLGVEDGEQEEFIDVLDEAVGSDAPHALFAERFQHPSFPGEQIYGFADPLTPAALVRRIPSDSRRRLAAELSNFLVRLLPPISRAATRIFHELAVHAESPSHRRAYRRELSCSAGAAEASELTALLGNEIRSGFRAPLDLWSTINQAQFRWPAHRTLAALDALPLAALPPDLHASRAAIRAGLLLNLERWEEALAEAEHGRSQAKDPLLDAVLLDRAAYAQQHLGRQEEARASRARGSALYEELLAQGDRRVLPLFESRIEELRRSGRSTEAQALEAKVRDATAATRD